MRRIPQKQVDDVARLHAVLDEALLAHVGVPQEGRPAVVPVGFARDGDRVLIHGSNASQAFRVLATGVETCLTVTLLDGLLVARSQFESSMHYRCAMVFGSFTRITDPGPKAAALEALSARLLPGLTEQRGPSAKESAATMVLELPLEEWSLKVSAGAVEDADEDLDRPAWAGVVPLERRWGAPVTAAGITRPVPAAIGDWPGRG